MGVLYLAVINLPRSIRFKWENVIVVGVIPGPSEPKLTINTYLRPCVRDLLKLWDGVILQENGTKSIFKAALVCTSSDVPATRKMGGFLGHNAKKG